MAKIPMGDFGQAVAQARPTPTASAGQLDGGLSESIQRLGNTGMAIAGQQMDKAAAEAKHEADKQAHRAEQIQQLTAHADIQNGLADLNDEIAAGVAQGTIPKDDARRQWSERSGKVLGDSLSKLPTDLAPLVEAQMKDLGGRLSNRLEDTIRKRDQQDADSGLITYREQLQRFAGTDMPGAIKQWEQAATAAGPGAGWSPEKIAKEVQGFKEVVTYTKAYEAVSGARNNRQALDVAEAAIGQMGDLDPQKRATLLDRVGAYKFSLDQKAELAAARQQRLAEAHLKKAEAAFNVFQTMADKGTILAPQYIDQVVTQTAGTPFQAGVKAMAQQASENGGLAAQPVAVQQATLDFVNAEIAKNGRSPGLDKRKEQIEKVLNGSRGDITKLGALRAAQERGILTDIAPLDMSSVQGMQAGIAKRVEQANVVGRAWAGADVSPLLPEEAGALASTLGALAPQARSAFIASMAQTVPPRQMSALAKQIDEKDRVLGLAMALGSSGTTAGRYTSELVMKGQQAIKDKGVKPDNVALTGTRAQLAAYLGDALTGKAREDVIDAASMIFYGLQSEGTGPDARQAVRLALGGDVIERGGRKLPIPSSIDKKDFETAVATSAKRLIGDQPVIVSGKQMPAADFLKALPAAGLESVGHGRYVVRAGSSLATIDGRHPLVLEVGNVNH